MTEDLFELEISKSRAAIALSHQNYFVFFRRRDYFFSGSDEIVDEEERKIFIELMERYCELRIKLI